MTSLYAQQLPNLFPYFVNDNIYTVQTMIRDLIDFENRDDVWHGSSFALTVDTENFTWNLWLSAASKAFLLTLYDDGIFVEAKNAYIRE